MLDERSKRILCSIIKSYINRPEPVGSRFITKKYSIGYSPATIRNIMADLEELGFLSQPHTSAGRVPTDMGYRFYVDCIKNSREPLENKEYLLEFFQNFSKKLKSIRNDLNKILLEVTNTLSAMSNYVSVVTPPKPEKTIFKRIDFIRYEGNKAAAVLLTEEGFIKNKIITVDPNLSQEELNKIADYLNSEYSGKTLDEIKESIVKIARSEKITWDKLIAKAIKIYEEAISSFNEKDIYISELHNVINLPDFSDISKLKEIAKAIKDKHTILKLLNELSETEGVQVFVGVENPIEEMKNLSVVASTYKGKNRPIGVIALIGPKRMDYLKAIFIVEETAKYLSKTFEKRQEVVSWRVKTMRV